MSTGYKIDEQDGVYYLTFQVVEWVDVFSRQIYREIVMDGLRFCQENKGLIIYAFVIMSNHVHLLVQSSKGELSKTIKEIKSFTAREIIRTINEENESRKDWMLAIFANAAKKHSRNKHYQIWTHENHAVHIFSNAFFDQKVNYIHENPVRAGIVEYPEDYTYSSAAIHVKNSNTLKIEYLSAPLANQTKRRSL